MKSLAGSHSPAWRNGGRTALLEWQGNTILGRQDKRGSPVVIQAIDMACFPACLSVGARAAPEDFGNDFNAVSGTVHLALSLAS
ncbi:MAG: hypothetical protein E5Y06_12070 [Mesorhizobium sp.]|uniref:hypothetical protein n=1 Tax=Mesorhizobium sp. TaxID=1871066 RepID=UPI00120721AB|nr:hypothetical protein [Mesorhizobium sp.]TIN95483.1 MAG: hypothetical protein E5Y06_12070 [Mesorhizobium sp.]TJU97129.1 MAG: hypothetical protein E5Y08_18660 [Mesorhizobium sp.]